MQLRGFYRRGFTLVELIMVVVLTGVMAVFVIPSYNKAVSKSYEKAGTNNLLIIYSAQQLLKNAGNPYVAGADTNAVNVNLTLGIIGNGINYSCTVSGGPPPTKFDCRADQGTFILKITDSNSNICCAGGTCPSVLPKPGNPNC